MLAAYFAAPIKNNCHICDNCIDNKNSNLSAEEFSIIENDIMVHLDNESMDVNRLIKKIKNVSHTNIWQVINFLLAEEILNQNAEGFIYKNNL